MSEEAGLRPAEPTTLLNASITERSGIPESNRPICLGKAVPNH